MQFTGGVSVSGINDSGTPRSRRALAAIGAAVVLGWTGAAVQAQTAPAPPPAPAPPAPAPAMPDWLSRIQFSGSIETYYDFNTNSPNVVTPAGSGQLNQLQNFNFHSNQFSVPLAELVAQETPDPVKSPLGFKLVLAFGDATDWIHGSAPAEQSYKNILQAYATYIANGKSKAPITVNLGKFVTYNGYEVIESQNNFNYSHGLLFSWAIPYYHTGISVSRPFGSKFTLTGYLVNGWNNVVDNNNGKTVGYTVNWTPSPKFSFVNQGTFGPENAGDEHDYRELSDNILTYTPNSKWTWVLNYDYGHDKPGGKNVKWQGVAGYAHYMINDKSAGTVRAELFNDHDGFTIGAPGAGPAELAAGTVLNSGTPQEVKEVTLTYEYRFHPRVITRFEVREDWSTADAFAKGTTATPNSKTQTQFIIGNIFTF